jgi:signal transduction histidine kinase/ActR/RegA family two-component response regulator
MFGWTEEEMMGKPLPPAFGSRDERVRLMAALRRGELITVETTRVRKDGVLINIMISAAPLAGPDGSPSGVVAVIADITEQKRLEDQLRQAQKMEAVGRLAGGIAHDFNNLLTIITGYDEMLLNSLPAETRERGYAQEILNSAEKASALTRQLLAFSRRQVANPTLLDINQVISDLTKMLRRLIGEDIDLVIVPGRDVIAVKADKGHIEQIVINLVVNARDAMPAGGRITIETGLADLGPDRTPMELGAAAGRFVSMSVTDTGQGMSEEVRSRLFEPFFTTKPEGHGTGLGLSTVYGIVRQNHGDIWVYSEPGKGSSFKVYLPAEDRSPQTELDPEDRILQQGKETVLLVEDEAGLRGMIQELLARLGYTVLTAANGLEAIRIASRHPQPIDLLLTDVVLPKESGSELAERVLRLRPHTRVLFMSGYPPETCVQHGVLQARAEFLEKPFALEALATKVRAVLDGNDPAANPKLPPAA